MKNIVKVTRFSDKATRLYILPEDSTVTKGTLVKVSDRFHSSGAYGYGVAADDSMTIDENTEKTIRWSLGIGNGDFQRVTAIYGATYEENAQVAATDDDASDEDEDNDDDSDEDEDSATESCTNGDYGPGDPWNAPGMSKSDFI